MAQHPETVLLRMIVRPVVKISSSEDGGMALSAAGVGICANSGARRRSRSSSSMAPAKKTKQRSRVAGLARHQHRQWWLDITTRPAAASGARRRCGRRVPAPAASSSRAFYMCHCSATMAPLTGCSRPRVRMSVGGSHGASVPIRRRKIGLHRQHGRNQQMADDEITT